MAWLDGRGDLPRRGISGSKGRDKRPGLDALLKGDGFGTASYKRTFLRQASSSLIASSRRSRAFEGARPDDEAREGARLSGASSSVLIHQDEA